SNALTLLNARPSLIASAFSLRSLASVRIAACGFDSAWNADYTLLDVTAPRQTLSFLILNGPIATFYDTTKSNVSFSFTVTEITSLDRTIPPGAEFTFTSAGYATVNSSYNTLTQLVIDIDDVRDREMV
ncbi:hypothetical protein PFISCL1PPCAC_23117, partial [Pristionchus fissidentatus]